MAEEEIRRTAAIYQFGDLPGVLRVESTEAMRALGNPIRASILRELGSPRSIKEIGESLSIPVARLYHHVKQLLAHGLIVEVEQRKAGSNTESVYQVAAGRIEVSAEFAAPWHEEADDVGTMIETSARQFADAFRTEARRRHDGGDPDPVEAWYVKAVTHLDADQAEEVLAKLREAIRDVAAGARRPPGKKLPKGNRIGISISVVPFGPSREHTYAEMRASPPDDFVPPSR